MTWTRCLLSLLVFLAAAPATVFAQNTPTEPKQYRPLPYSGSLADVYKQQMLGKDAAGLQNLIKTLQDNPKLFEQLKKLGASSKEASSIDPALLDKLLKNNDGSFKNVDQLKEMQETLKKLQDQQAHSGKAADAQGHHDAEPAAPMAPLKGDRPDPLSKPAKWLADKIGDSSLPKEYPAFGKFKEDMLSGKWGADVDKGLSGNGLEAVLERWFGANPNAEGKGPIDLPIGGPLPVPGGGVMPEMPSAPLVPNLVDGLGNAAGGLGDMTASGGLAVGQTLLIVVVFAVVAGLVWRLFGPARRTAPQLAVAALGPWPVDPARIATREQLVQAFEYLALLLLGSRARSANHLEIAGGLATSPEKSKAAGQLASLYEKARYDPARGELVPADLSAASRDLLFLAGSRVPVSGER